MPNTVGNAVANAQHSSTVEERTPEIAQIRCTRHGKYSPTVSHQLHLCAVAHLETIYMPLKYSLVGNEVPNLLLAI